MRVEVKHEQACSEGEIRAIVEFEESSLRLTPTPFGALVELASCDVAGAVGSPGLPRTAVKIAVPPLRWPGELRIEQERFVRATNEPIFVAPIQPERPAFARRRSPPEHADPDANAHDHPIKPSTLRAPEESFIEPFPAPPVVPPDPELYEREMRTPRSPARPLALEQKGIANIAQVELNPVRLSSEGRLELCTRLEFLLTYVEEPPLADKETARRELEKRLGREIEGERLVLRPEPSIVSRREAARLAEITRAEVLNPDLVGNDWKRLAELDLPAEYLIVTDNQTWDAKAIIATGEVSGDIVAAFERLANWKRSRGLRVRVVTISEIVEGRYGSVRPGARDLQEVIRRFLKRARKRWGVSWLVLGGDVDIVPIRSVAGAREGEVRLKTVDPPKDNESFWTGSQLKVKAKPAEGWWPAISSAHLLVRSDTGELIPYDPAGSSSSTTPGWYFTTTSSYSTRSATATDFVRVNGPKSLLKGQLQWLYEWNTVPTDLYYSSLQSYVVSSNDVEFLGMRYSLPYAWIPEHDWDANDNGIYGQHTGSIDLDGVVYATDLSVGRAPVASGSEAEEFVDKVIAYERFRSPEGSFLENDWLRRVLLAASNWGDPVQIMPTSVSPPGDDQYHHASGASSTLLRIKDSADFAKELIAELSESDRRVIPYSPSAKSSGRGWHFAKGATDLGVNEIVISLPPFKPIRFPYPSEWIVVYGSSAELAPVRYLFDSPVQDGSMADQEELRVQLKSDLPQFNRFTRLYKDELDLTPAQLAASPVQHLTPERLRDALNAAPHIVSLSGHGHWDGCCGGSVGMASTLTNGHHSFIAYADSCFTNRLDVDDAFGEALVYNANGGAVGYIGNTRYSFIGVGDNIQRAFFKRLTVTRHLGLLNDSRLGLVSAPIGWPPSVHWAMFALNLVGDPELRVWRQPPRLFAVEVEKLVDRRIPFVVRVSESDYARPLPVADAIVHVSAGLFSETSATDGRGEAAFDLGSAELGDVRVTVSGDSFAATVEMARVVGPGWVSGLVTEIAHGEQTHDETLVRLQLDGDAAGGRGWWIARRDRSDYEAILDAVTDAFISKTTISLFVDSLEGGGVIERFRFLRE